MNDHQIADAMVTYGGTFISRLGKAFQAADDDNQQRIKTAFPEYWAEYTEIVILRHERANKVKL